MLLFANYLIWLLTINYLYLKIFRIFILGHSKTGMGITRGTVMDKVKIVIITIMDLVISVIKIHFALNRYTLSISTRSKQRHAHFGDVGGFVDSLNKSELFGAHEVFAVQTEFVQNVKLEQFNQFPSAFCK